MSAKTSNKARTRCDTDREGSIEPEPQSEPPAKRRMTSKSPEPEASTPATFTSIFGGGSGGAYGEGAGAGAAGSVDVRDPASAERRPETAVEVQQTALDRLFSERVVTVHVGPSQTTWRLHENLLSSSSDFFRSAFNSGFLESHEDKLLLPEDDPAAFELFVRWLYGRAIVSPPPASAASASSGSAGGGGGARGQQASATSLLFQALAPPPIQTWLRLYALACKLMVEELENICAGAAWRYYNVGTRRPDVRDVQYIYENTPPGCGMRRLLREKLTMGMFRGRQNNPVTEEWRDVFNETPDLGFDIVSEISGFHWISGNNAPARPASEECAFHRHEKGEVCR